MTEQPSKPLTDVPYISMRTLVIMHVFMIAFILLVHLKLSTMTGS